MSAWITGPVKNGATTAIGTNAKAISAADVGRLNRGLLLRSLSTNTATLYVGAIGVTAATGWPLEPGESLSVECTTCAELFVVAASGSQELRYIGS